MCTWVMKGGRGRGRSCVHMGDEGREGQRKVLCAHG